MGNLRLSDTLSIPDDYVTQTGGILGKRGSGKTATAGVICEELLELGHQVVVLDPVGVWWGLRTLADGDTAGYPVLVLGGDRGDLPLDAAAGRTVADFVVGRRASCVLDLGGMSKSDQTRFVAEFLERVYHAKHSDREPLHLVIDEADAFAPQRLHPGAQRCFGAVDVVVRRGRARGLGVTLVTQRSAAINKDVLSQIEVLFAFRTLAPQDRDAIEAWIEVHGTAAERQAVLKSLASLEMGECWLWSPSWLEQLVRVRIRRRRTFDSSATPTVGSTRRAPTTLAQVDIDAFKAELSGLIEKAEQEDPRRLRARIAALELAAKNAPPPRVERVEIPVLNESQLEVVQVQIAAVQDKLNEIRDRFDTLLRTAVRGPGITPPTLTVSFGTRSSAGVIASTTPKTRSPRSQAESGAKLEKRAERAILAVLAQHGACNASRLALLAGYRWSGGFRNALSSLRTGGLIEGGNQETMTITSAGLETLSSAGGYDSLPKDPRALIEYWLSHPSLGMAERKILTALCDAYPSGMNAEKLAQRTGYTWSGGFRNALSALRTAGLIEGRNTESMRASANLFESGARAR